MQSCGINLNENRYRNILAYSFFKLMKKIMVGIFYQGLKKISRLQLYDKLSKNEIYYYHDK